MDALNLNGTTLHIADAGRGEPLVLVHGSASDHRTWDAVRGPFAERYRVLTYSRRYHPPNLPIEPGADYSMDEHVADLAALLDALDTGPVHLVGHSYGALMGLELAQRAPERLRSLVLMEPPAVRLFVSPTPTAPELVRLLATRPRTALAIMQLGAKGIGPATAAARRGDLDAAMHVFGRAVLGPEAFAALSPSRREQVRANLFAAEFTGSGFLPIDDGRLRAFAAPTLLVTGADSPPVFHRLADRLEELLPGAQRVEIPGASHILHEDNPAAVTGAVLSFLGAPRGG